MKDRLFKPDVILGAVTVAFALMLLCLWIPNDVDGDIINVVRRRASIGDPMAPTITGWLLLICGTMLAGSGVFRPRGKEAFTTSNLGFLVGLTLFFGAFSGLLFCTGPVLVSLFGVAEEYRLARALIPWKYTGFLVGGFVLLLGLMGAVERRISRRALILALLVPLAIALAYDLPFDDALLPPNGDF